MNAVKCGHTPNFSVISRREVIIGIRQAKNSKTQKKIFADLCCCTVNDIEKILKEEEEMSRWTEQEINELKNYVSEGKSHYEMAEHFGRDVHSVDNKIFELRKKGILPPKTGRAQAVNSAASVVSNGNCGRQSPVQDDELRHYKERCEIAESALEAKIRELAMERQSNAELRILAKMIGKVADL